eukprot:6207587-Pleurochrysis_carterae.AAC.2
MLEDTTVTQEALLSPSGSFERTLHANDKPMRMKCLHAITLIRHEDHADFVHKKAGNRQSGKEES